MPYSGDDPIGYWVERRIDSGIEGHYCSVGGVPRPSLRVKVCECGQVYKYGTGWWPFGLLNWRHASFWTKWRWRKRLAQIPDDHQVGWGA